MPQFWENDQVVGGQSAPAGGPALRPVLSVPDPRADREEQRDQIRTDLAVQGDADARDKDRFDRLTTYRKEFISEPMVRQFREVENATRQIVDLAKRGGDQPGPGDIALVISFMKALDPGSVVREGEFATAENAGGVPERLRNAYNKFVEGGRLSPDLKREFASTATSFYNSRLNSYNTFAQDYRGLIQSEGGDPDAQGVRLAEPMAFDTPVAGGTSQRPYAIVSPEESAAIWGAVYTDAQGNPVGRDYDGELYDESGNPVIRVTDEAADPRVQELADAEEARLGQAGMMKLANQGITLGLADEAAGVGGAIGGLLFGDQNSTLAGDYQLSRDVERELVRRARERTGWAGTAAELIGGGAGIRAVGGAAMSVGRAAMDGARVGGLTGFGYGEGANESLTGAAGGAALGGALGGGLQRLANRTTAPSIAPSGQGAEAVQAADNLNAVTGSNIRLMPADVSGPGVRNATGGASKMTLSGEIIGRRAEGLTSEAEKAKDALVALAGGRAENEIAGEAALEGARKWMKTSATKRDALYSKARRLGGDQPVDLANARQVLDEHIAELAQTPGSAAGLERLRALRAELDQPFPVEGVKRMRTRLRDDFGSDGLRATDIERRVGQVIDAAEDDIVTSLNAAGKGDAARAYSQASKAHRERVEVIDEVLVPIIGKKGSDPRSGEDIIVAIERAAQSKSAKLGRFINTLPAEDAGVVRGTLIDRLGRATAGQQDAGGNAFSLNTFLTNWSKMSDRAKSSLFGGELRASLEDLAKVANARRESGRFVNFSNTGSTMGALASGGALAGSLANPATLGLFAIDGLTGAILSSPRLARWLAKMPANPGAQRVHIQGLSKIAAADATIAADALGLQAQLQARFQSGQLPLAAEGQGENTAPRSTAGTQPQ